MPSRAASSWGVFSRSCSELEQRDLCGCAYIYLYLWLCLYSLICRVGTQSVDSRTMAKPKSWQSALRCVGSRNSTFLVGKYFTSCLLPLLFLTLVANRTRFCFQKSPSFTQSLVLYGLMTAYHTDIGICVGTTPGEQGVFVPQSCPSTRGMTRRV